MSRTFYKATRLDGTDFRTGTILYAVGKRVRPATTAYRRAICGPGYLHAADTPSETLVGGRWPCRLFEVTGTPKAGFDGRHPHKGGFKQLVVVRELLAHEALGPNGEAAAALIERAGKLTYDEARAMGAARVAARGAARGAARDAARGAARDAARVAARDAAWVAARDGDAARGAARDAAWGAGDAVLAIVVQGLISEQHFKALYGPWGEVVKDVEVPS